MKEVAIPYDGGSQNGLNVSNLGGLGVENWAWFPTRVKTDPDWAFEGMPAALEERGMVVEIFVATEPTGVGMVCV